VFTAAIFDMDGLLIDSERAIMQAWLSVTSALGLALTQQEYVPVIGRSANESAAILRSRLGAGAFDRAFAEVQHHLTSAPPERLFPPKPGAQEILLKLRTFGVQCAVVSSTESLEVARRLEATEMLGFFQIVIGGEMVTNAKPDPAIYRLCTEKLLLNAPRCLAFEDSDSGVASAHAAGVKVVLVPDLKAPELLTVSRSLEVFASLTAAIPRLETWFTHR
jgi:HAD superfamily hydrolase (TIGR01509 family)